jgi:hypothetical protein
MNNDKNLEIVSEILEGVSIVESSFGILYFKHLSQQEQRKIVSEATLFETEAKSQGLISEKEALKDLYAQEMWSEQEENEIINFEKKIKEFSGSLPNEILPSRVTSIKKQIEVFQEKLNVAQSNKEALLGLTQEKYVHNKTQKSVVQNILFYDIGFKKPVFEDLYVNERYKELEIYKLQKKFFTKFQDDQISKAVLSEYFSMYLPFCEDVIAVFGKPLVKLTNYQLKLISYGRYFLNIFKNTSKEIPENISKDPELLISFHQSQRSDNNNSKSREGSGGSTYFGANENDIKSIKNENETAVDLSEEVKKRGGSMNMEEMMKLHGL